MENETEIFLCSVLYSPPKLEAICYGKLYGIDKTAYK